MPDHIGPHLLGRRPSPPDERDLQLAYFLNADVSPLEKSLVVLQHSHAAKATKDWASIATGLILGVAPAPTPDPTPAPPAPPTTTDVVWADDEAVLDQGDYGTCVGNGCAQWGNTLPVDDRFTEKDARAIYLEATTIDGQPDDPDKPGGGQQGSTVRSGMKALQNRGRLQAYAFATDTDTVREFVRSHGPVVVGTDWYDSMFSPTPDGYVAPSGKVAGGHCWLIVGDLPGESAFLAQNSWGAGWGLGGRFKITWSSFAKLLTEGGEAAAAAEMALA